MEILFAALTKLIENIANLAKVKTIVTLMVMCVFCKLAMSGLIDAESAMNVVLIVIAFYFGTQSEKKS